MHPTQSEGGGVALAWEEGFLFKASLLTWRKRQHESFASVFLLLLI